MDEEQAERLLKYARQIAGGVDTAASFIIVLTVAVVAIAIRGCMK